MNHRQQFIEEIAADLHGIKNKMHGKMMQERDLHITYAQQFALFIISQHEDAGIKEISKMLCTSSSAATQLVNELVRQKLVIRKVNSKDKRALYLTVTIKGKKQIIQAKKTHQKIMSEMFSPLNLKELKQFIALHKEILHNI